MNKNDQEDRIEEIEKTIDKIILAQIETDKVIRLIQANQVAILAMGEDVKEIKKRMYG